MAAKKSPRKATKSTTRSTKKTNGAQRTTQRPTYRTLTPYLAVRDATQALTWYKKAFGATEISRMPGPGGKIMHAEVRIGDSVLMLSDVFPGADVTEPTSAGGTTATIHVYTKDIDRLWKKAVAEGATVTMPLDNQFWGDRYGKLKDPFGHSWSLAFPAKMTEAEKKRKQEEAMRSFGQGEAPGMTMDANA